MEYERGQLFDASVAREYEAWYEQGFGRWAVGLEQALLAQQLATFPGATTLLEVGCGTGHFSRWFASQGLRVTGLDASPTMLDEARRRDGAMIYLEGDAQALPFNDRSFDLVAYITVLEFLPDPASAVREGLRVARRGLLLGVLNHSSLVERWNLMRGRRPVGVLALAHRYRLTELTALVRRAAGERPLTLDWRTTIYPWHLPLNGRKLPWGEYLSMTVTWPS